MAGSAAQSMTSKSNFPTLCSKSAASSSTMVLRMTSETAAISSSLGCARSEDLGETGVTSEMLLLLDAEISLPSVKVSTSHRRDTDLVFPTCSSSRSASREDFSSNLVCLSCATSASRALRCSKASSISRREERDVHQLLSTWCTHPRMASMEPWITVLCRISMEETLGDAAASPAASSPKQGRLLRCSADPVAISSSSHVSRKGVRSGMSQ
mmetsp:Transcript_29042/g.69158  ORF Transcript_29042/g.69158 Transcript_29042/m.69158 type:complete len:212 (-) Transcript_29042:72-707(-)